MKENKLGTLQAASVIITVMLAHIILNMPNHLIASTGSSTILNLIYVFTISAILFYIASRILGHFPKQDLIDICEFARWKISKKRIWNCSMYILPYNIWICNKNIF